MNFDPITFILIFVFEKSIKLLVFVVLIVLVVVTIVAIVIIAIVEILLVGTKPADIIQPNSRRLSDQRTRKQQIQISRQLLKVIFYLSEFSTTAICKSIEEVDKSKTPLLVSIVAVKTQK